MNDEARQKLRELVIEFGSNVSDNPLIWRGYLTDRLAEHRLERQALISALNENVPDDLLSSQTSLSPLVQIERLTQKLVDNLGLQSEVARWAVESWALALDVLSPNDLNNRSPNKPKDKNNPLKQWISGFNNGHRLKLQLLSSWKIVAVGAAIGAIVFLGSRFWFSRGPELLWGGDRILTVGVLAGRSNPKSAYLSLREHLKSNLSRQLGTTVNVEVDIVESQGGRESYDKVEEQLKTKKWDVAFTLSPIMSIAAIDNGYDFAARMFPGFPQYESALFVRADSPIKSEADFTSNTTIALEGVHSPHGFYMPIYDLYGKSLRVDLNNSSIQKIMEKVSLGQVDVGAGIYQVLTNPKTPELQEKFRIIGQSRGIPVAGVYISPDLTPREQDVLRESLLTTPAEIQQAAQYGKGTETDYSNFTEIVRRVDKILVCTELSQTAPVNFFCSGNTITGTVNGYNQLSKNTIRLKLQADGNKVYDIILPQEILTKLGLKSAGDLSSKRISVTKVKPVKKAEILYLNITASQQIKVIQ